MVLYVIVGVLHRGKSVSSWLRGYIVPHGVPFAHATLVAGPTLME